MNLKQRLGVYKSTLSTQKCSLGPFFKAAYSNTITAYFQPIIAQYIGATLLNMLVLRILLNLNP